MKALFVIGLILLILLFFTLFGNQIGDNRIWRKKARDFEKMQKEKEKRWREKHPIH